MRRSHCVVIYFLALSVNAQNTGSIAGKLVPELIYTPMPNAIVVAIRQGLPPFSATATADSKTGIYQVSGLPAGTYQICAQATGFVDACQWTLPTLIIAISAGQTSKGNDLLIRPGAVAKVRVDDPSQFLAAPTTARHKPHILTGAWDDAGSASAAVTSGAGTKAPPIPPPPILFHPMRIASQDASGVSFELIVPHNRKVNLHISSPDVILANAAGVALTNNADQTAFQHNLTDPAPPSLSYKVVGRKP